MLINDHEINDSLYAFIYKSFTYLKRAQKKVPEKKALGFCIHKRIKARYDSNTNLFKK